MKQLLRVAARLYPRPWRDRYGREFDALIDDLTPRWEDFFNIIVGALVMQISRLAFVPVTIALVGAIVGAAISLTMPPVYASSSQVLVHVPDAALDDRERSHRIRTALVAALHQTALDKRAIAVTLRGDRDSSPVLLEVSASADSARSAKEATEKALASIVNPKGAGSADSALNRAVHFRVLGAPNLPKTGQRDTMRNSAIGGGLGFAVGAVVALSVRRRRRAGEQD
jgi:hypothetical protein